MIRTSKRRVSGAGKEVTMNIGKNIDQQILNGKRGKRSTWERTSVPWFGFGKKPEQGGFGRSSRRMKNGKRIMMAARKIVDRTCECPAHNVYRFLPGSESKIKSARSALRHQILDESAWDRKGKGMEEAKSAFFPFSSFGTDISVDLLSGRNARKTGSVSGKTIERTLNVICVF